MDETQWTLVDIIGPAILVVILAWLVIRAGRRRTGSPEDNRTEQATRDLYREEEQRRRDGTDGL